ncbi:MAG: cytochrome c biogenesis protein CcsA [Clostridia bacterium]|nr:cytochrome c biogenesis protein CcsA [Clostridia bacterium]
MTDSLLRLLIFVQTVCFGAAFVLYLLKKTRPGRVFWLLAETASVTLVIHNFLVNGYVPFVSMYQILTFSAALFGAVYLYIAYFRDAEVRKEFHWTAPYFIGCSLTVSVGLCFMDIAAVWQFPPALRSPWFLPHILVYVIAYIMAAAAFAMTVTKFFVRGDRLRVKQLDGGIYDCVCVLFPCMTAGMLLGAVWANEVWGAFWSWDIKECWALVTWLMFMTWLHFRRTPGLSKFRDLLLIAGFVCVIVTFFFVNGMNAAEMSMHTYN